MTSREQTQSVQGPEQQDPMGNHPKEQRCPGEMRSVQVEERSVPASVTTSGVWRQTSVAKWERLAEPTPPRETHKRGIIRGCPAAAQNRCPGGQGWNQQGQTPVER